MLAVEVKTLEPGSRCPGLAVLPASPEQIMLLKDDRYLVDPIYTDVGCEET